MRVVRFLGLNILRTIVFSHGLYTLNVRTCRSRKFDNVRFLIQQETTCHTTDKLLIIPYTLKNTST